MAREVRHRRRSTAGPADLAAASRLAGCLFAEEEEPAAEEEERPGEEEERAAEEEERGAARLAEHRSARAQLATRSAARTKLRPNAVTQNSDRKRRARTPGSSGNVTFRFRRRSSSTGRAVSALTSPPRPGSRRAEYREPSSSFAPARPGLASAAEYRRGLGTRRPPGMMAREVRHRRRSTAGPADLAAASRLAGCLFADEEERAAERAAEEEEREERAAERAAEEEEREERAADEGNRAHEDGTEQHHGRKTERCVKSDDRTGATPTRRLAPRADFPRAHCAIAGAANKRRSRRGPARRTRGPIPPYATVFIPRRLASQSAPVASPANARRARVASRRNPVLPRSPLVLARPHCPAS